MMRRIVANLILVLVVAAAAWPTAVAARQADAVAVGRGPQFLVASGGQSEPVRLDVGRTPVLRRNLSLQIENASIAGALAEISSRAGLNLVYSAEDLLPAGARVTLRAEAITVAAALTHVLLDAGVDILFTRNGVVTLVPQAPTHRLPGTIVGRVTAAETGNPVPSAQIALDDRGRAITDDDGRYRVDGVSPGIQTVNVTSIGYASASREVEVGDGATVTVDFALDVSPTTLSELVVTATGQQRRVELGHVVGRIKADSVVKAAPVSSLSELLNGRVPGLQVNTHQGTVGGEVDLRVRTPNSLQSDLSPIVIVDGVRYTSGAPGRVGVNLVNFVEQTSPLNDLNPNEIESIEVAKGPSAVTLYGTDAANGVIVITTKRGRPGPARWQAYVRSSITEIPDIEYPDTYWGWTTLDPEPSLPFSCVLGAVASGFCSQDSVTVLTNPLNDPAASIFKSAPRWDYGANVSGGLERFRYFFAVDAEQATGPIRMPSAIADSLADVRGGDLLTEQQKPNSLTKLNLRSNITASLGDRGEVQVNAGYSQRTTHSITSPFGDSPYAAGAFQSRPGLPYGPSSNPENSFSRVSSEKVKRVYGSLVGRWSPTDWLIARATAGLDVASSVRASLARRGESTARFTQGAVGDDRGLVVANTFEAGATASFAANSFSFRASAGVQYVRNLTDITGSSGTDLPPGSSSIGDAANVQTNRLYGEEITVGGYVEQVVGWRQRLFLTGALRVDGASTFGRDYNLASYPKLGLSWLASEEPFLASMPLLDELRLRYAFGASALQPRSEWARAAYAVQQRFVEGASNSVFTVTHLGNPDLRPERVREHEFGFDGGLLGGRASMELTWYRRKTVDQIVSAQLPPGLGAIQTNLGLTTAHGFEAQVTGRLVESNVFSWDVTLLHASHGTELVELGQGVESRGAFGGWVEGYPIGARFQIPFLGFEDANGDGIITPAEIQMGDTAIYVGQSWPTTSQSASTSVGLFGGRVRLSALVERRAGFTQLDRLVETHCAGGRCRGRVDPTAPLAEQAAATAFSQGFLQIEPGDFTRLREVSLGLDVPTMIIRRVGMSSATVTLQGRNLALWSAYSGPDPESASPLGTGSSSQSAGIPQARFWTVRIDLGF